MHLCGPVPIGHNHSSRNSTLLLHNPQSANNIPLCCKKKVKTLEGCCWLSVVCVCLLCLPIPATHVDCAHKWKYFLVCPEKLEFPPATATSTFVQQKNWEVNNLTVRVGVFLFLACKQGVDTFVNKTLANTNKHTQLRFLVRPSLKGTLNIISS